MALRAIVSRNLLILSLVSLFNDFSTDMVFPLLPYFLLGLGATAVVIGVMEGLADSIAAFLRYASGRLSDRYGRRRALTVGGYAISSFAKAFYPVATHPLHVVGIRGADRVGKGFREAPRDAMIAESINRAYWGFAFGFHRMLDTTGALLGPLAALVLIQLVGTSDLALRTVFAVAAVPAILSVALLAFVRETGTTRQATRTRERLVPRAALRGPLARYLVVTAFFTLGNLSVAFLILRATELEFSLVGVIFFFTCYNATEAVASLPVGNLTDRIGRPPVLVGAYALFTLVFGLAAWVDPKAWWELLPFFGLLGIARALREGQGRAFVADLTPGNLRATGFGAYHATIGFLALPAGYLAGRLWVLDHRWTFLAAGAFCTVALGFFLFSWLRGRFARREPDSAKD